MDIINIITIAIGLAMDALAVSIASAIKLGKVKPMQVLRMAGSFGLFQCLMPIAGWFLGRFLADYIAAFDHWIAFTLLAFIGLKMFFEKPEEIENNVSDPTKGLELLMLAIATSIDAMAVGFSFAVLKHGILWPSVIIGLVTLGLSSLGMLLGVRLGRYCQKIAGKVGGVVLLAIGLKILLEHLLGW